MIMMMITTWIKLITISLVTDMVVEYQYVFVNVDADATNENNELASPVLLSSGEANFVNQTLDDNGSNMRYKLLSEDIPNNNNS